MAVSIDTYTEEILPKVSIDTELDKRIPVDPEVAKVRAFKAAYGIKDVNPRPQDEIYKQLVSGYESVVREQTALEFDKKKSEENYSKMARLSSVPELTSDMVTAAVNNLDTSKHNPDSIFEEAFAKTWVDSVDQALIKNYTPNARQPLSEAFQYAKPGTSNLIAKQQYLLKWAQDIERENVQTQSWPGYLADFGKNLFQPYQEIKQRGNVSGVSFFQGPLGYNLKQQGIEVLRKDLPQMIATLKPTIDKLKNDNPQLAVQYLASLAGMTNEQEVLNNLFTFIMPLDYVGLGSVGRAGKGVRKLDKVDLMSGKTVGGTTTISPTNAFDSHVKAWSAAQQDAHVRARQAAMDLVRAANEEPVTPAVIASASGDVTEAGVKRAADIVDNRLKGINDPKEEIRQNAELLTSNYRIDKKEIANNVGSRGSDFANRVLQGYDRHELSVLDAISKRGLVNKLPGVFDSEDALRSLGERIRESGDYKGLGSSVGDIEFVHDIYSNTHSYNIVLRQTDGSPFHSHADAEAWLALNRIPLKDVKIVPEGLMGFSAKLNKPLKETDSILQDLLVPTAHERDPDGLLRSWLGWALNPDETLSEAHRENRKIAAYGPSWLMSHMKEDAQILKSFARGATKINPITGKAEERQFKGMRGRYRDWERMIKALRVEPDPDRPDQGLGRWLKSVGEMESYYDTHYGRLPTDAEVQAYFAYKRINEYDRVLRDLRYYSNMWREGVQNHALTYTAADGSKQVLNFRGNKIDHLPRTEGSLVYVRDYTEKGTKMYDASRLGTSVHKEIEKGLEEGTHFIYRVWNPDEHEFAFFGPVKSNNHWVRYVVIKGGAETSNIPFNLLPRRGGGHWDVDHPFYLSQPNIYFDRFTSTMASGGKVARAVYAGATTIMPIQIRAMGEKIAGHLNEIRKLIKSKDMDAAEAYHALHAKEIAVPYDKIVSWFNPTKDAKGRKLRPMLNLDHDIRVRPKDVELVDMDKSIESFYTSKNLEFMDGTKRGNPARQAQVQYTGMRDAQEVWTINDRGTRANPLYDYEPAQFVDPIETMNRALTKITQSTYLEDYKQFAVTHWMKQASPFLEVEDNLLANAPYHHFYDPKWKSGVTEEQKRIFMAQNMNIRQFLGMANPTDKLIKESTQKMIDQIYGKFGPNAVKLVPEWMLFGMSDPIQFIKQITYHAALGLFAIPQLFVQMQTYALIAALSPKAVASGIYATMLHGWAAINPKMVETLDKWATKLNIPGLHSFKAGEFKEAREIGFRLGFFDVQGEHAMIDDTMRGNKLVKSLGREFLDWGTAPFRGGERAVRLGAWYTAYREFRQAHPTGRITQADEAFILNRADDLYGNMSRASSSRIHTGLLSIPTQFLSYQLRIAELFMGSRTSAADKARMFATFAAMYGVPMATGLTGLPLGDYIKRKSLEEGYVVGDNWIMTMIQEGIPSMFVALATGGGDMQKGTFYNFGERYGTNGMDLFRGDKNMWDVLGGAAFSKAKSVVTDMSPFWQVMMSAFRDDDKSFPIVASDFLQPLKNISSVNSTWGTIATLQTGRIMSKKGLYLDDASPLAAIFMGVTGLKTTRTVDANYMTLTIKERDEYEKAQVKEFETNFKKGVRIAANGQPDEAKDFFKRAFVYLWLSGAREDQLTGILARAAQDNESFVDSIDWQYYVKQSPEYARSQMYDTFSKKLNAIQIRSMSQKQ